MKTKCKFTNSVLKLQALNPTIFANKTKSNVFEMKLYNFAN